MNTSVREKLESSFQSYLAQVTEHVRNTPAHDELDDELAEEIAAEVIVRAIKGCPSAETLDQYLATTAEQVVGDRLRQYEQSHTPESTQTFSAHAEAAAAPAIQEDEWDENDEEESAVADAEPSSEPGGQDPTLDARADAFDVDRSEKAGSADEVDQDEEALLDDETPPEALTAGEDEPDAPDDVPSLEDGHSGDPFADDWGDEDDGALFADADGQAEADAPDSTGTPAILDEFDEDSAPPPEHDFAADVTDPPALVSEEDDDAELPEPPRSSARRPSQDAAFVEGLATLEEEAKALAPPPVATSRDKETLPPPSSRRRTPTPAALPPAPATETLRIPRGTEPLGDALSGLACCGFPDNPLRAARLCLVSLADELGADPVDALSHTVEVADALEAVVRRHAEPGTRPWPRVDLLTDWQRVARRATLRALYRER